MARVEVTGIAGTSRNSLLSALKEHYFPKWKDAIQNEQTLNGMVNGKNKGTLEGRQSKLYHHYADVPSAGLAAAEYADLPTPVGSTGVQGNLHARDIYSRVRLTGQVERSTKGSSYVKAWQRELSSARRAHNLQINRMLYLGPRQILGTVESEDAADGQITMYGRDERRGGDATDFWKFGAHYLRIGMPIAGIDAAAAEPAPYGAVATGAARYITSISGNVVTFSATPGGAAADFATELSTNADGATLVPFGSRVVGAVTPGTDSDSQFYGINGLLNTISNTSIDSFIYDLSRATYPSLSGTVSMNGGTLRAYSDQLLDLQIDTQNEHPHNGGQGVDCLLMNRANRRTFVATTEGDRRFKPVQTSKGYGKLSYVTEGKPSEILTDRDAIPGIIFCLAKSTMGRFEQSALSPLEDDMRFVSNKDAHESILHESFNFACENIPANGWLDDMEFDTDGVVSIT